MLELSHVSKTYKTSKGIKTNALQDVSLKFPQKGMVFILGKSGSGKSTLLNVIGGLDQADEGEIILHGKSSKTFTKADYDAYRNTYIGFIFQEFYLIEEYTIEKNIALSLQLQQKEPSEQEIEQILKSVGLSGYGNRYPNELSGGQKQRVAIARSLIKRPQILLADEPTGALDSTTGKEIFDTLKELSQEKLVIVVSHDEDSAERYADHIIRFADGRVIENTNPEVAEDTSSFVPIKSHLPFKDSFHLGITCLRHKKLRMIFTILLTSFALLTLALSDSVGCFNSVDAQYKAMNDQGEYLVGVRRQAVDEDGYTYFSWQDNLSEIHKDQATKLMNEINGNVAKVYDSQSYTINLNHMGIYATEPTAFESACTRFRLAEMNSFDDLHMEDVIGSFPKNTNEVAISSYLADLILTYGIANEEGETKRFTSYEEIIDQASLHLVNREVRVVAIIKQDFDDYHALKDMTLSQLSSEDYTLYRRFSSIVNQNSEQLFVKDGFVKSLNLEKEEILQNQSGLLQFNSDEGIVGSIGLTYPKGETSYYDGKQMRTLTELKKNEVLWDVATLSSFFDGGMGIYDENFYLKSDAQKEEMIKDLANRIIGKQVTLLYNDLPISYHALIDQEVIVKGVILPEDYDNLQNAVSYASRELVEPLITDPFYIGELLMYKEGAQLRQTLKQFPSDEEFSAHTIASDDVNSVQGFAQFATKVFLVASIAFFAFAGALMMNFIVVSIAYRKKEIGILRSIGARSKDVMKIFVWEALILALISYVITVIALYILAHFVNVFAMDSVGMLISPVIVTIRQPLLLIIIVMAIAFIASFIPILRIARQRPIDAIKK